MALASHLTTSLRPPVSPRAPLVARTSGVFTHVSTAIADRRTGIGQPPYRRLPIALSFADRHAHSVEIRYLIHEGAQNPTAMPAREFDRPVFTRLRRLCLALPETTETSSWGHPNFRAGKKMFCAFELCSGRPSIAFRVTAADAKRLARKRYFFATPYGRGMWVSRWVDVPLDPKLTATLIGRSYRHVAPKKLIQLLDSSTARKYNRQPTGDADTRKGRRRS